ncbi:MAG TPA: hypothetical protein VIR58_18350 [Acidimicrobiales bacterium]
MRLGHLDGGHREDSLCSTEIDPSQGTLEPFQKLTSTSASIGVEHAVAGVGQQVSQSDPIRVVAWSSPIERCGDRHHRLPFDRQHPADEGGGGRGRCHAFHALQDGPGDRALLRVDGT